MAMSGGVVVWEWLNEFGRWRAYDPHVSDFLEKSHGKAASVPLGHADPMLAQYSVDFQALQQYRAGTGFPVAGTRRPIRRNVYPLASAAGSGVAWQWSGDIPGQWQSYDMEVACILEDAFNRKLPGIDLRNTQCRLPYTVNFTNMTQMRNESGFKRQVKRVYVGNKYTVINNPVSANGNLILSMTGNAPPSSALSFGSGTNTGHNFGLSCGTGNHISSSVGVSGMKHSPKKKASTIGHSGSPKKVMTRSTVRALAMNTPGNMPSATTNRSSMSQSLANGHAPMLLSALPPAANGNIMNGAFHSSGLVPGTSLGKSTGSRVTPAMTGMTSLLMLPTVPMHFSSHGATPLVTPSSSSASLHSATTSGTVLNYEKPKKKARKKQKTSEQGESSGAGGGSRSADDVLKRYVTHINRPPDDEDCCICCEKLTSSAGFEDHGVNVVYKLSGCDHMFHKSCLCAMYNSGPQDGSIQCPTCKKIYGEKTGNCPQGKMDYHVMRGQSLPGHHGCDTIRIIYYIPPGIQGPEHPNPGQPYTARGFPRHCYLPDNDIGRKILRLLVKAWERRLTFTIGTSATTGETSTVVWNEIHHKTEFGSNRTGHGFPDPNYFNNVLLELASQGVTEDS